MRWPVLILTLTVAAACATEAPEPKPSRSSKPTAPVELRLEPVSSAKGWEVTLVATPTRDVDAVELRLGQHTRGFGATKAGTARTLTIQTPPGELVGEARLAGRSKAIVGHIGVPEPRPQARPIKRVTLPGGIDVAEVRQ